MTAPHLYVHVPFCARRCSYCAFSIAVRREVPAGRYVEAAAREMQIRFGARWTEPMRSLYLGGGTPSHLGGAGVKQLLATLRNHLDISSAEVTLETNPEDVTDDAIASWLDAGINRISLGVQSLSDDALRWMHRVHDAARARAALASLTNAFERVSADIIFALPSSVAREVGDDVAEILESGVQHVSIYGLTVEQHTPYSRWIDRGQFAEAPEENYESEYLLLHNTLNAAGFDHYEVSSFAQPGHRSLHNSAYWTGAAYVGIGPAAHGFDGAARRWNVPEYGKWLHLVDTGSDPVADREVLNDENRIAEEVYLGLRVREGLHIRESETEMAERWVVAGWGQLSAGLLLLSPLGWLRLDSIAASLTAARSR